MIVPVTSFATGEVKGDFMGVPQEFAHTRLYADMDLTFYVDSDYQVLRFFEGWMDYISEVAASTDTNTNVYRRFNYPEDYKIQGLQIFKFEKDYKTQLSYKFVNAFPKGLVSIPVSYGSAELLKITATFNYDRYVVKREEIYREPKDFLLNEKFIIQPNTSESTGSQSTLAQLADQGAFDPQ